VLLPHASVLAPPHQPKRASLRGRLRLKGHVVPLDRPLGDHGGYQETPCTFRGAVAGNVILGPALVEAADTTYVVDPEWRLTLDVYRNAILDRAETEPAEG